MENKDPLKWLMRIINSFGRIQKFNLAEAVELVIIMFWRVSTAFGAAYRVRFYSHEHSLTCISNAECV